MMQVHLDRVDQAFCSGTLGAAVQKTVIVSVALAFLARVAVRVHLVIGTTSASGRAVSGLFKNTGLFQWAENRG